ncbi:hypothetical protein RHMOL_Rhmol09G0121000 [Rhododendron molle]|uniref:Uncharacterized protein n=1 Tax=Rhododendron molle TaxID=49168 RepID=A0ACC0MCM1_RHOML|nr:hypothetical protein RHMOL_Rhmol09G0121000 [Rhododendron molle]
MTGIIIESNALTTVQLINEDNATNHPQRNLINDVHAILERTGSTLNHIYREAINMRIILLELERNR